MNKKQTVEKNDLVCSLLTNYNIPQRDLYKIKMIVHNGMNDNNTIRVWTDGSYNLNSKTKSKGGIGFVIDFNGEKIHFGKKVATNSSTDTEIMSLAVALSYILDTFDYIDSNNIIKIYYDASIICEKLPDVIWGKQMRSPYTNLKSALKRYKKRNIKILFEHVKAHDTNTNNNIADAISKYYSGIDLNKSQQRIIKQLKLKKE